MMKKSIHTLSACGEDNGKAKLTARKVVRIRALRATGLLSFTEIARVFKVHHSCIANVCWRRTWASVA